jgi:hypothetical protein
VIQPDLYAQDTLTSDPDEPDEGEAPAIADTEGLRRFLEGEVLPWFETRKKELANRPLIREQAFGEALDTGKLEPVSASYSLLIPSL